MTGSAAAVAEPTDRPARSEGIDISPVDDGYVIYDPATDLVHHLNPAAAIVLELCTGQAAVEDIAAYLAGLFPAASDVPEAVGGCVRDLRGLGLVQPAAGTAGQ